MSDFISIEIPREILLATRMSKEDLRLELAISLFQQGKLSFGKAREMIGMSFWAFQQLLSSRGIPIHYDFEDYEADLQTLQSSNK